MRVNAKVRGDCFGEVSLMYSCPRSATVAATQDAVVWVLERDVFRRARRSGLPSRPCAARAPGHGDEHTPASVGLARAQFVHAFCLI
jgi:CRP-like cAMP-binding protein